MKMLALMAAGALVLCAQETLLVGKEAAGGVVNGTPRSYSISLGAGDYVGGAITQKGRANIVLYQPNGSLLRRFPAPARDGKRAFAFSAETAGTYRIELAAADQASSYELTLGEVLPLSERLKPAAWRDPFPSPRIDALRKQIAAGQADTEPFWKQMAREGTPMAEPFGTDGRYQLATFLWRGGTETRNVQVLASFHLPNFSPADSTMHRLAESDVWYLTVKLPAHARFTYRVSPNDPLIWSGPRAEQRTATLQADPLNKQVFGCLPNSSKYACSSLAEMPGAVPQPWIVAKAGTPEGKLTQRQIHSEIQKLERPISIYTPAGYRPDGPPNALLILTDAETYLLAEQAMPTTMNNLIAAGKIPRTVAVLVSNVGDRRLKDLVPNEEFANFMTKELVPWVRANYNVTKDPALTVIGGYSAGGLWAGYMGLRHSDVFGNVLSQSGSFWWGTDFKSDEEPDETWDWNAIAQQFAASPKVPVKFYMDAGTFENDILRSTQQLRDVLLAKGNDVRFQQFVGGHDGVSWRGTLADGLMALIGKK